MAKDPAQLKQWAQGAGGGGKAMPFGKGGGSATPPPPAKKGTPQPPKKPVSAPESENDDDQEHEDTDADEQPEGDNEHEELVMMAEDELDAIEGSIDDMDPETLKDEDAELSDEDSQKITEVLDGANEQFKVHVKDISMADAKSVAEKIEGVSDPEAFAGWLYHAGQLA